jgi:transcriptional regulator with XRE-family HTH domain
LKRNRLAARRRLLGLSQEDLAEVLGVATSTVARWEQGTATPRPWYRPVLAETLNVDLAVLDDLLVSDDALSRAPTAGVGAGKAERIAVAVLRQEIRRLDGLYDTTPSSLLVGSAGECLGNVLALKDQNTDLLTVEFATAEAEAATLVGQLVWDASQRREHAGARRYFEQARTAALAARNPAAEGLALLRQSFVSLYGEHDPRAGLDLASHAAAVGRTVSPVLVGLGLLHAAEAYALMQRRREAEQALANAENHLGRIEPTDPNIRLFSPSQPGRLAGSCYLSLHDERRAQTILEATLEAFSTHSKNQAIVWGNLALAHLRQRKVDEATGALHRAIDVVEATRGGAGLNIVFDAGRELRPWRDLPVVRDLHDRLLTLMTAA